MKLPFTSVRIEDQAFINLVTSAMEVFEKETYGLLIGSIYKKKVIIKNAIPYQAATRKKWEVSVWPSHEEKFWRILNHLTNNKILGDFHSHAHYPAALSKHDIKHMIEEGIVIALLMTIEKADYYMPWHYDKKDKSLKGSLLDEYAMSIKVYYRPTKTRIIRKLKIDCPYIKKINKRYKEYFY